MDECGSYCHYATDGYYHAAVVFDTDKFAFDTFEDAAGDTDTFSFAERDSGRFKINKFLITVAGNCHEAAHLDIRNDDGLIRFPIHDVTDRGRESNQLFDGIDTSAGGIDEYKVVDSGYQFPDTTLILDDVFVAHRDKVLDAFTIQEFFQGKLTTVSDAKSIPRIIVCSIVHKRTFFGDTGVWKYLPVK